MSPQGASDSFSVSAITTGFIMSFAGSVMLTIGLSSSSSQILRLRFRGGLFPVAVDSAL
jgi:hypothetical protein